MAYILGVDVGTTTSKGVLVTDEGRAVATQVVAHPLSTPRPGWAEEDAERDWWGNVVQLCRGLLAESGVDPRAIVAVGVSSLGPSMAPLDAAGRPLRPALLYGIDTRAAAEIVDLTRLLAERGVTLPQRLTAQDIGPKLLWFQRHEPDLWRQTRLVLGASGFVVWRLTGEAVIDDTCAMGYRPFFDERTRGWHADRCALIDLDPAWLPPCRRPWEIAGTVTAAAAAETGLAPGTPVSAGVMDVLAEFLTGGATDPGDGVVTYGTTMCILRVTGEPVELSRNSSATSAPSPARRRSSAAWRPRRR